jgi:hypothetical protein
MDGNDYNNTNRHERTASAPIQPSSIGTGSMTNQDIHEHMGLAARPWGDHPKYLRDPSAEPTCAP